MVALDAMVASFDSAGDSALHEASLSSALATIFRGNFCDIILPGHSPVIFKKDDVIYDMGSEDRTPFFIRSGFVKVGTITEDAREIVYDVRKAGEVVGELCACQAVRGDRAVALERSEVIPVPYSDVIESLQKNPGFVGKLIEIFCRSLAEAYDQINTLAYHDTARRLVHVLLGLAAKIGRRAGEMIEIPTYLTQEDISQMVAARRERVSTALNLLRRRGMVRYSGDGHLFLDVERLKGQMI